MFFQANNNRCGQEKDKILGSLIVITKAHNTTTTAKQAPSSSLDSSMHYSEKKSRWFRINRGGDNEIDRPRTTKKESVGFHIGDRVEILEGADKNKMGFVMGIQDRTIQVVVEDRGRKARLFHNGSVRSCRTTVASTQQGTNNASIDPEASDTDKEKSCETKVQIHLPPCKSDPSPAPSRTQNTLNRQTSLIDKLENRSVVKSRVESLLDDLVEDENRPPVSYISFSRCGEMFSSSHLRQSRSNDSTLTTPSVHDAHRSSRDHLHTPKTSNHDQSGGLPPNTGMGRVVRSTTNDPTGRTMDPPVIDVTAKFVTPSRSQEHIMLYRKRDVAEKQFMVGATVQVTDGIYRGRRARVVKVTESLVQVQIGSQPKVFLAPNLLRVLPDPPSTLDQLWWSL